MQDIEPFYGWEKYYTASEDEQSPFYEREYNMQQYENTIYGYYIHPLWDDIGSETLYCKILFANYDRQYVVIELFGEWNDTLHNDIMYLKRQVIDPLVQEGIKYFILISENILNFHGSDDSYYEEWFEDVEDGWIAAIHSPEFIEREWKKYHLDYYINFGGTLDIANWRTLKPANLFELVNSLIIRRLGG
ncbi:hypothetical protein GO755_23375 [Spirosoma sp. HMF4905]|uniref:Uncharacterized protein n=1 Tax=Spirosoma arboris TaxID=2682092 RepID=A0A7K1SGR2_9BACT|nr:hypothetical protein [Spirosoma arboris]MVM33002.1 hypothetical protein [Spirosoma arboris]